MTNEDGGRKVMDHSASKRGALPQRLTRLAAELVKFGAVGGVGLLVNLLVFNLVRHVTDLQVVRASVIATVVAIACNYIGFRYFTYRDRDKTGRTRELTLFLLFSAAGLIVENGILYAATYGFGWDSPLQSNFFKFSGIAVATLFRFWSYRTWVFKALPTAGGTVAAEVVASAEEAAAGARDGASGRDLAEDEASLLGTAAEPAGATRI